MKMTEHAFDDGKLPIDGYAPEGFRIGGQFFEGPVLLDANGSRIWEGAETAASLDAAAASPLSALAGSVDVVLIGLGSEIAPIPAPFRAALDATGVRYDTMGTPAACRTYNVLLTEARRVAVALLVVNPR